MGAMARALRNGPAMLHRYRPEIEGAWREWAPPTRAFHAMVYDSRRDRLVVLGGDPHFGGRQTLWQLPLAGAPRWSAFAATGTPPAAEHVAAAYDSTHDRIVAFLAISDPSGSPLRSEVWLLSLAGSPAWSHFTVSGTPAVHFKQSVALDGSGKRLFLVSTSPGYQPIEAWQLDLASGA